MAGITWKQIRELESIKLYAGDLLNHLGYPDFIGLSITKIDDKHILQDATKPIPLKDNTVDIFVSEDVFEHIQYNKLPSIISEIYRILKPGGLFRWATPDYGCDILQNRTEKDGKGQLIFDPVGGGSLAAPGHTWFPRIESVKQLLSKSIFYTDGKIEYLHYYEMDGSPIMREIDHSIAPIKRTPDFDDRVKDPRRPMSLVVDLFKKEK